jgi:acetyl-CoA C-acetyltransferase
MPLNKIPRGVAIVGAGMSKFGAFPDKNGRDLFVEAYKNMTHSVDKGLDPSAIESFYLGNFSSDLFEHQGHTAPLLADAVGLTPIPAARVENACASGATALRQGVMAIASGMVDVVLVGGAEKMTNLPTADVTDTLATAGDVAFEIAAGFHLPRFLRRHRHGLHGAVRHDARAPDERGGQEPRQRRAQPERPVRRHHPEVDGRAREIGHQEGQTCPTWGDIWDFLHDDAANPMIAWPLRLFDCSPDHGRRGRPAAGG